VKPDGQIKAKGLYARAGVLEMKNPTMEICSKAAANYLALDKLPETTILTATDIRDFVAVRSIKTKGGGVQHTHTKLVDDWIELERGKWMRGDKSGKTVKRVSRPAPVEVGYGGVPFGRVARWYMTTEQLPAITQVNNGNQVPKTEGARRLTRLTVLPLLSPRIHLPRSSSIQSSTSFVCVCCTPPPLVLILRTATKSRISVAVRIVVSGNLSRAR
jgi:hypothetical protein